MIIHVVQPGDTIQTIAKTYGKSIPRLLQENELTNPDKLIVGQTIVIVYPKLTYTVKKGDTLVSISEAHGITQKQLLRNNPYLSDRKFIYPGEEFVISYVDDKTMKLSTNGYAFPFIDKNTLRKTLPYLTYLTIFSYGITTEGELIDIDDTALIQIAKEYGVAPLMLLSSLTDKGIDQYNVTRSILHDQEAQNRLIENVLTTIKEKGYYGLNVDTPYMFAKDRPLHAEFISKISTVLKKEGYDVAVTISPNAFELATGMIEFIDYSKLVFPINVTMLLSYEWGYSFGLPMAVIPFTTLKNLIEYTITQIPKEKIYVGVPSIGYLWQLPYVEGVTRALSISNASALELAGEVGATIQYNEPSQSPFFIYEETNEFIVWFKDARSIDATVKLIPEYGLKGIGIWNIMNYFPQMWLIINSQYEIESVY